MYAQGHRRISGRVGLVSLFACLLVLVGCGGAGSGLPDAAPTLSPTLDLARLATMVAQRTPGSRYTPAANLPPVSGPPCPEPGPPLTPATAAPVVPSPAATGTPIAGAMPQTFPGPCVDHWYDQPLAFSPDGRALAIGGAATVALYDPASGRALWALPTPARPTAIAFAPDGAILAIGLADGRVLLCRVADGAVARILDRPGRVYGSQDWYITVGSLSFSPDGLLLAGGYVGLVAVWPLATGGSPTILGLDPAVVEALAFEEGGAYLRVVLPGSIDSTRLSLPNLHRWRTSDWRLVDSWTVQVIGTASLTGNGPTLATAGDGVAIWNLGGPMPMRRATPLAGPYWSTTSLPQLAFSPRGDLVVGGTSFGKIYLWDAASETVIASYAGPEKPSTGVALAPDDSTVAAVFPDGTVYLWRR